MDDGSDLDGAVRTFAAAVRSKLTALAAGEPEDQLRGPTEALLAAAGATFGKSVIPKGETLLPGRLGKPDYAVLVDNASRGTSSSRRSAGVPIRTDTRGTIGSSGLGSGVSPTFLYSDGNEWALYRDGHRVGGLVRFPGDLVQDGASAVDGESAQALGYLLLDFFSWHPIVPTSPKQLAEVLAPLCRLLRDQVRDSLVQPGSPLAQLASDWRGLLFPEADDEQFSDAYAQTVAYALLLARAEGAGSADPGTAAATLGTSYGLLGRALQVLTDQVEDEIGSALAILRRTIEAVDPATLRGKQPDPWLYFYEDFLAAYDPRLWKNAGVYYTPIEVVRAQVRLADHLLRSRLGSSEASRNPKFLRSILRSVQAPTF